MSVALLEVAKTVEKRFLKIDYRAFLHILSLSFIAVIEDGLGISGDWQYVLLAIH